MWISFRNVAELFEISQETVVSLREENAALKAELTAAKSELQSTKINLDWLRVQYNQAQLERAGLLNKAYGITVPAPELATTRTQNIPRLEEFSFDHIDDETAKVLGIE